MAQYRKKPIVIEAIQIPQDEGDDHFPFQTWCREHAFGHIKLLNTGEILVHTLEGSAVGKPGDWLIKGVKDEIYPCADEIFRATYEGAGVPSKERFALLRLKDLLESVHALHTNLIHPDAPYLSVDDFVNRDIALFDCPEFMETQRALEAALEEDNGKETN